MSNERSSLTTMLSCCGSSPRDSNDNNRRRRSCCTGGSIFFDALKAMTSRLLFMLHALLAVWRVTIITNDYFWCLSISLAGMVAETGVVLFRNKGREWKWFQPSVLLFLICVVPPIWILELDNMGLLPLTKLNLNITEDDDDFPIQINEQDWLILLEQSLLVLIIIARWLTPKGDLTRDQLSSLLLAHLGTASDIVDFYSLLATDIKSNSFKYLTLCFWTWSLLQFPFVVTTTRQRSDEDDDEEEDDEDDDTVNKDKPTLRHVFLADLTRLTSSVGPESQTSTSSGDARHQSNAASSGIGCKLRFKRWCRRLRRSIRNKWSVMVETEAWAIFISVIMQDGPFFFVRLVSIVQYRIVTSGNYFFVTKNAIVLLLQLYRLGCLYMDREEQKNKEREEKLKSWKQIRFVKPPQNVPSVG